MTTRRGSAAPCVLTALWAVATACTTAGGAPGTPAEPVSWPPGRFLLEGSVSYSSGFGTRRETHVAHLVILPGGSMSLDPDAGICREPTPAELRRDERNRRRTFRCGDVTFEVRPASGTVVGELRAMVTEDYSVRECVQYSVISDGERVCLRYRTVVESRRVEKEAPLRARREP